MLAWLSDNIGTIFTCVILLGIVGCIVWSMVRTKKKGGTTCGCGCENCALHGQCHKKPEA